MLNSIQDVVDRVKDYILAHPDVHGDPTRWIEGMGWDQTKWPEAQFPTAVSTISYSLAESAHFVMIPEPYL